MNTIIKAHPDVFNHNIETARDIFKTARPQGNYDTSLGVLKYVKENSDIKTKSGFMIGLLTIGQYIQPSKEPLPVAKYYNPEEYEELKDIAKNIGIKYFQIGPLVRSSYNAAKLV